LQEAVNGSPGKKEGAVVENDAEVS